MFVLLISPHNSCGFWFKGVLKRSGTKDNQANDSFQSHCDQTLLPNKMLRSIILITLLISSVCGLHLEKHKAKSIGNELKEDSVEMPSEQLPGLCWACKWAMGKLKSEITKGSTKDDIKKKLGMVCDEIGFLKSLCRKLVNEYKDTLVEELSTTDDARTICVNIGVCKK
uniref:Antimicrobial peptide NK-lysin-like n=1 Tax=Cyprinus carpio TaxID=7962 RepID=A0A8C1K0N2_CYPCA